jgi:hypothetical protein
VGAQLDCRLQVDGAYRCTPPGSDEPLEPITGIVPERVGLLPGVPLSAGDRWELAGRSAEIFLRSVGVEARVRFVLDEVDDTFRGHRCNRISYAFNGNLPVELSHSTFTAELEGEGEVYYCPEIGRILHHRQERTITVDSLASPGGRRLTRSELITLEEETLLEP